MEAGTHSAAQTRIINAALELFARHGVNGTSLQMIADAGFVVEGQDEATMPGSRRDLVTLRRRGPGTAVPANT